MGFKKSPKKGEMRVQKPPFSEQKKAQNVRFFQKHEKTALKRSGFEPSGPMGLFLYVWGLPQTWQHKVDKLDCAYGW